MLSFDEAAARVTAPGQPLEIVEKTIGNVTYKVFKNAPPTLREIFATARGRGEQTFLVYEGERWSFGEVMTHVDALGAALVEGYGIKVGDRVAVGMRNLPEWIVAFAAILSVGGISVSLNAWWTEDELAYALKDSGVSLVLADPERMTRMTASARELGLPLVVVRNPADAVLPDGVDRYEDVVELGTPLPKVDFGAENDATILYTSGTTADPKGAVSTHRAVVQALMAFGCRQLIDAVRQEGEPYRAPAGLCAHTHPHGAAVPRDRLCARDALVLRQRNEARDDVPVGRRRRPCSSSRASGSPPSSGCPPRAGTSSSRPTSTSTTRPR